jgi:type IV pilus assembly protein PilB
MSGWIDYLEDYIPSDKISTIKEKNGDAIESLLKDSAIPKRTILEAMAKYFRLPYVDLTGYLPDDSAMSKVPLDLAKKFGILPLFQIKDRLYVAVTDPDDLNTLDYLRQFTGLMIEPVLALRSDITQGIGHTYLSKQQTAKTMEAFDDSKKKAQKNGYVSGEIIKPSENLDAPVIKLLNFIITQAIKLHASDIHLEPFNNKIQLRYRIDGVLHEFPPPPSHLFIPLITRIKVLGNMDVAEKRLPQDGRIEYNIDDRAYDLRVSIIPNLFGEGTVIRVLDKQGNQIELEELGFSSQMLERYQHVIKKPYGIFLVTGPTGSGKSSTLYATLKHIYSPRKKIITIEDPVEYQLEGVEQIQIHPRIGFTFASGLRAILRHDPDVIMLGEIRDLESAEIAIRSSLTGHYVFSTLHTNDSLSTITRLIDIGIPPFLVLASLAGVLAQRLVRRLCPDCKQLTELNDDARIVLGLEETPKNAMIYKPIGCSNCNNLGYRGRIAIFEFLEITPEMKQLQDKDVNPRKISKLASATGFTTLKESVMEKLFSGITSLEETLNIMMYD